MSLYILTVETMIRYGDSLRKDDSRTSDKGFFSFMTNPSLQIPVYWKLLQIIPFSGFLEDSVLQTKLRPTTKVFNISNFEFSRFIKIEQTLRCVRIEVSLNEYNKFNFKMEYVQQMCQLKRDPFCPVTYRVPQKKKHICCQVLKKKMLFRKFLYYLKNG